MAGIFTPTQYDKLEQLATTEFDRIAGLTDLDPATKRKELRELGELSASIESARGRKSRDTMGKAGGVPTSPRTAKKAKE